MAEGTAVGASSRLAGVAETSWGVTPSNPSLRLFPFLTESLASSIGIVENNAIRSDRRYPQPGQGNLKPAGDIRVVWNANALAWILYRSIGGSVVPTGSAPWTHTINESPDPALPSFTLEKGYTDVGQYFVYEGVRVNTWSHEMRPEANVEGSISVIARNELHDTAPLDPSPEDIPYVPLNSYDGTALQGGSPLANITEMTLNFSNNVTGINVLFNQFYGAVLAARFRISGSFGIFFVDATQYLLYRNFTETDLDITMQDEADNFIQYQIRSVRYAGQTPQIGGEGPVFFQGDFTGYIDSVSGQQLVTVIRNDIDDITT